MIVEGPMLEHYGSGTNVACAVCGRRIFFTKVEVTERDGKRWVELTCKSLACTAYLKPRLYDEGALEIHGTAPGA